ncbi:relaxase domain-containing protein [Castellaniella sp.]|uniref:relaxase domain-containing protein n=1 Tax=Castellaniella sp. TaxID=1955812 RepID=UPI003C706304
MDPARFKAMLQGDFGHGITAVQSVRKDAKARAARDLTFGAPKSITLQVPIGGDDRLIQANDDAVATALAYVEKHLAMGRRKEGGKSRVEHTGNLIVAKFRHETARPKMVLLYAYTTTAHSTQGLTCDRVLYNAESFSRTTAQDTYYVSISRERHEVVVFTDDADELPERVDRLGYKGLAHDLQPVTVQNLESSRSHHADTPSQLEPELEVE